VTNAQAQDLTQDFRPRGVIGPFGSALSFRPLLELVEPAGETRDGFGTALAALLSDVDPTNLVGVAGIPGHRGFFSEFGDRFANHLLPSPRDERDLRLLTGRLYRTERDVRALGDAPLDLFHRVAAAVASAPPPDAWNGIRAACADVSGCC
jgi:site-specific recombinase